jgi:hypothetical protein
MAGPFDFIAGVTLATFGEAIELRPLGGPARAARGVPTRSGVEALGLVVDETRVSILAAEAADMDGGGVVVAGALYRVLSVDPMAGGRSMLALQGPVA